MAVESGSIERLFWQKTRLEGVPLANRLKEISEGKEVWFVGHSLGGAMATIAFAAYKNWCNKNNKAGTDAVRLLTFASPMVGNKEFVEDFEKQHKGKFLHVVDKGDPIPYLPPMSLPTLLKRLPRIFDVFSLCNIFASAIWGSVYLTLWKGQCYFSPWSCGQGLLPLGRANTWMCPFRHTRDSYKRNIKRNIKKHFADQVA